MSEDFLCEANNSAINIRSQVLHFITTILKSMGWKLDEYNLIDNSIVVDNENFASREMVDELFVEVTKTNLQSVNSLNFEQKVAFNLIMSKINNNESGGFFLDGPGGTGKTFLYCALLATIRSMNHVALAIATVGIVASILPGSCIAHSRFKIPIDSDDQLNCSVSKQSNLAELLRAAKIIIWDRAFMAKRQAIEAFDNMLRDLMDYQLLFGGKVVVFGGDFHQVLPVLPKATLEQTKEASLVKSKLWSELKVLTLTQNMRLRFNASFTDYLLRVGNRIEPSITYNNIRTPENILLPYDNDEIFLNKLIDFVFPNIFTFDANNDILINKAILTPKNYYVDDLNEILIKKFPGEKIIYRSHDDNTAFDSLLLEEDFLNTLTPNGYPPNELVLKIGSPITLHRNIDPSKGLSNGTRLTCRTFDRNVIDAEISTGHHKRERVFIPRIPFLPNKIEKFSFPFKRVQFPIRLCFAITINKAQGKILDTVGVYLPEPVFSHGQLYVALSQATSSRSIRVLIKLAKNNATIMGCTPNIICKDILELAHPNLCHHSYNLIVHAFF
ncbi:hypothetical protein L1049_013817 [Liquidambar formosana]|uniref:ATP-dependent DNA helicase n=1 Tax=Liquidambar formosana TaxID=63359 RepID=A0AAP0RPX0_LIQFO